MNPGRFLFDNFIRLNNPHDLSQTVVIRCVKLSPMKILQSFINRIALFHQDRELALDVLARWYGIEDREFAETVYARGAWIPREPYPCYEGIARTMELYDSNEMRKHEPIDFYDDSAMRQIVESGFIDSLYADDDPDSP